MYFIEWKDEEGNDKSFLAEAWIVRDVYVSELEGKGFKPTSRLVEEVVAERV
ncbi:hypothetical protein ACI3ER_12005 [Bacillus sp. Wb]